MRRGCVSRAQLPATPSEHDFDLVCEADMTITVRLLHPCSPLLSSQILRFASCCSLYEGAPSRQTRDLSSSAIGFTHSGSPAHSQSIRITFNAAMAACEKGDRWQDAVKVLKDGLLKLCCKVFTFCGIVLRTCVAPEERQASKLQLCEGRCC